MKNLLPIYVMHEEGVSPLQVNAVLAGINGLLEIAGVRNEISVHNFGRWRSNNWLDASGALTPEQSIDWYLAKTWEETPATMKKRNQLQVDTLINLLYNEHWQKDKRHYDVVILKNDISSGNLNYCIGSAVHNWLTVISVNRFMQLPEQMQEDCIITETLHEVGHVFGLVPQTRTEHVEESLGKHCTRECIMRQGLRVPDDWIAYTNDRLRSKRPLCLHCVRDLKQFFS